MQAPENWTYFLGSRPQVDQLEVLMGTGDGVPPFDIEIVFKWRTLQEIETVHMIRKGRVRWLAKGDVVGQAIFIAWLFDLAA